VRLASDAGLVAVACRPCDTLPASSAGESWFMIGCCGRSAVRHVAASFQCTAMVSPAAAVEDLCFLAATACMCLNFQGLPIVSSHTVSAPQRDAPGGQGKDRVFSTEWQVAGAERGVPFHLSLHVCDLRSVTTPSQ
jgi:hypothetical protein